MLTAQQVHEIFKNAGVSKNIQFVYKIAREKRIPAQMKMKNKGYRFQEEDVKEFITHYQKESENPLEKLEKLEEKCRSLSYPQSVKEAGYIKRIETLENQLETTQNQLFIYNQTNYTLVFQNVNLGNIKYLICLPEWNICIHVNLISKDAVFYETQLYGKIPDEYVGEIAKELVKIIKK